MNENYIILFLCMLFILYIILTQYRCKKKRCLKRCINESKENYSRVFPPVIRKFFNLFFKTETPLRPLISPIKEFPKDIKLPEIYIYNPKYFSPVRDQGSCGGCWAFTISSMLSDNITIKILKFGKNLNVQQLLSCYPSKKPCEGEAPEDVLLWLEKTNFKI